MSPDSVPASALGTAVGTSASARLSLRTELARTLQKTVTFAALAFLDLPFSRSYFELTSGLKADAVPLGFRGPLILRVLPGALRGYGKNGEF